MSYSIKSYWGLNVLSSLDLRKFAPGVAGGLTRNGKMVTSYLCTMKVLMVCLGNICRSPLAEGILKHKLEKAGLSWEVESAGTNGYHIGENPHRLSQKVARHNGIDISCQECRLFTKEDVEYFDRIYAMANDVIEEMKWIAKDKFNTKKIDLLLNVLYPGQNKDVPDPWYGGEDGYHEVYKLIDEACEKIVENALFAGTESSSQPSFDKRPS